ncbi:MAG: MFS transporter [Acidimicrobiia bacterium]
MTERRDRRAAPRWHRILPSSATPDAAVLFLTRALRAVADGLVSVVLPGYLVLLGFSPLQVGAVVTGTLIGSAALTLAVGLRGYRLPRLRLLRTVAAVMVITGVAFGSLGSFWPLFVVAVLGTLNPSAGDVSVFLPTEQALLPGTVSDAQRTALYARYSLVGFSFAALGSLAAAVPEWAARRLGVAEVSVLRSVFVFYACIGAAVWWFYRRLSPAIEPAAGAPAVALGASRSIVRRLAAVFSLDAFAGGFVVQSLLVLWLARRHGLSTALSGGVFFWAGLLSGASALVAVPLARRIGLIRTMVFTHLPANALLVATAFMPNATLAIGCLLARSSLSQMDVPARTSYVMAVVTPAERPAAASVTNVPRSLAAAASPLIAGWMLDHSSFGWPLIIGGTLKALYDLTLLALFRNVRPPEEAHRDPPTPRPRRSARD